MPRNITPRAMQSLRVGARDDQFLALLTIEHPSIDPPIRVCCDETPVISQGLLFEGCPFSFTRLGDSESTSQVSITVKNVDRRLSDGVMELETPARVTLQVILRAEPDTLVEEIKYLNLVNARITSAAVEGTLIMDTLAREPWPNVFGTKARFPGLWFR